jgi:MFS family permease
VSVPTADRGAAASVDGAAPGRLLRLFPALAVPPYRLLWLGMLPGTLAWQMSVVATGYAAFVLSDSATVLGLVSSAIGLPMLLFSLIGGVVADRLPRRRVLLMTQGVLGLAAAALAFLSLAGVLAAWHLVALGLAQGTAFAFNMPARQAYIAELVSGKELLRSAVALNNAGVNFCRIAGPALGGLLLSLPAVGVPGVFVAMTAMYGLVLASLTRLPASAPASADEAGRPGGWAQLVEGLRYIRSSPVLLALLGLAFLPLFVGMPYQTLMPVFSERVFEAGAAGLGTLMAANGVGALTGSIAVAALSGGRRLALLQLGVGVLFGVGLFAFGLAPGFWFGAATLLAVGFASASYTALNSTLIMANTEPRLYGRVMSVWLLTFGLVPLATLPAAWLADRVGAPVTVAGAGALVALFVVGVAVLYPPYRRIR